jgi:osmotically inducible protein OsmC
VEQQQPSSGSRACKAEVTAIGGRSGFVQSSDRGLRLELGESSASALAGGQGTNPEQLLAAAYASCFLSAIRQAAREEGIAIPPDANVTARIDVEERRCEQAEPSGLGITLMVDLPGIEPAKRNALVERAHAVSRCSRALRGTLAVHTIVD